MNSKIYKQLYTNRILLVVLFFIASVGVKGQQDKGTGMYYFGVGGDNEVQQSMGKQNAIDVGYMPIDPNSGTVHVIDYNKDNIPAINSEFSFYPKISNRLYYTGNVHKFVNLTTFNPATITQSTPSTTAYCMFPGDYYIAHNVGKYNGQEIDMKVTLENIWVNKIAYNDLPQNNKRFYYIKEVYFINSLSSSPDKQKFLQMYGQSGAGASKVQEGMRVSLKYEFFKAGSKDLIEVQGFWNLFRINNIKAVSVESPFDAYILKVDKYQLYYKNSQDKSGNIYVTGTTYPPKTSDYPEGGIGPSTNYTYTFKGSSFNRLIQNTLKDQLTKYDIRSLTKIDMGAPSVEGFETTFPEASFAVYQDIPPMIDMKDAPSKLLYKSYELTIQVPPFMDMTTMNLTIKDVQNSDANRLALFEVTKPTEASPKFVLKVKTNGGTFPTELYENSLEINIKGQINKNKKDLFKNYIVGNYIVYKITEDKVSAFVDGQRTMNSSNTGTMKIAYQDTGVSGTAIPQIVNINTSLTTLQAGFESYVKDLNGGLSSNKLTLANNAQQNSDLEAKLKQVGFAGFLRIKIIQNSSGEGMTVSVPVSVIDGSEKIDKDVIVAGKNFNDKVSNVPGTTTRATYVKNQTNAIAWNSATGASLTSKIAVTSTKNFMTLNPMVAGSYEFTLKVNDPAGSPSKSGILGTIIADLVEPATGTAIPQIVPINTAWDKLYGAYETYVKDLNGGLNNNTLSLMMPITITQKELDKVGFAGFIKIKIKQNTSGEEKTVYVPVSVVDGSCVESDGIILSGYDFSDNVSNVPNGEAARNIYVLTKANAIAWDSETGDPMEVITLGSKFMTLNPMVAGEYTFMLFVADDDPSRAKPTTKVKGTITDDPNITVSGQRQYCEGEAISLQAQLNNASTETINWYYQPIGGAETSLNSSSKTYTKTGATNANTGYYIAKLVKNSSVQVRIFVSVAANKMYWKASASNNNWNDIANWVDANGKALNAVPGSCTNVYIRGNTSQYPNLKDNTIATLYSTATTALTSTTEFGPAKANQVNFAENAKMQYTHKLAYNDVVVHLDGAPTKQWTMVSVPISEVYAGDNLLDDANGRHVYFRPLTDGKKYNSHTIELNQKMTLGVPYLYYLDGNLSNTKMTFPSTQTQYDYVEVGPQGTSSPTISSNITRSKAKFIYETTTPSIANWTTTNGNFTISYTANGGYAIVNNPFMANLDIAKFVAANSAILDNKVSTVASDCLELKEAIEDNQKVRHWEIKTNPTVAAKDKILPFESIVIKLKTNTTSNIVLTYSPDMTTQD